MYSQNAQWRHVGQQLKKSSYREIFWLGPSKLLLGFVSGIIKIIFTLLHLWSIYIQIQIFFRRCLNPHKRASVAATGGPSSKTDCATFAVAGCGLRNSTGRIGGKERCGSAW